MHWRHLCASSMAVWASCPMGTSLKLCTRTFGSCSGIGYFFGTIFFGAFFCSSAIYFPSWNIFSEICSSAMYLLFLAMRLSKSTL